MSTRNGRRLRVPAAPPAVSEATERLLTEWTLWQRANGYAARTITARLQVVRLLEARTGVPAAACTWQDIAGFFVAMVDAGAGQGTRATYYNHVHRWYRWLIIMDHRVDDPSAKMRAPQQPRRHPRPISIDQLDQLLRSRRFYGRTRTMILLAAYQGLRAHEIAKIRGEDFTDAGLFVRGKGGVEALLPVHPVIDAERAKYPATGWWFPSYTKVGVPITGNAVSQRVGAAMRRAGVEATAHQLRHYFGTQVYAASGGDLRVAQELLRHGSPATTALYTAVDDTKRRAALLALPAMTAER